MAADLTYAQHHPEHNRTSCSDEEPSNAEPTGSHGCARCTALLLDQRDRYRAALARISERCPTDSPDYTVASVGDVARMALAHGVPVASKTSDGEPS